MEHNTDKHHTLVLPTSHGGGSVGGPSISQLKTNISEGPAGAKPKKPAGVKTNTLKHIGAIVMPTKPQCFYMQH